VRLDSRRPFISDIRSILPYQSRRIPQMDYLLQIPWRTSQNSGKAKFAVWAFSDVGFPLFYGVLRSSHSMNSANFALPEFYEVPWSRSYIYERLWLRSASFRYYLAFPDFFIIPNGRGGSRLIGRVNVPHAHTPPGLRLAHMSLRKICQMGDASLPLQWLDSKRYVIGWRSETLLPLPH
jgi:hypothetical protein